MRHSERNQPLALSEVEGEESLFSGTTTYSRRISALTKKPLLPIKSMESLKIYGITRQRWAGEACNPKCHVRKGKFTLKNN